MHRAPLCNPSTISITQEVPRVLQKKCAPRFVTILPATAIDVRSADRRPLPEPAVVAIPENHTSSSRPG